MSSKPSILILDDDVDVRRIMVMMLKEAGFRDTISTDDIKDAVRKVKSGKVGLLLLDWEMPQKNGIEILKEIRMEGNSSPIVMLTANSTYAHVVQAMEAGANDYVVKPCSQHTLVEKINKVLGIK